MYELSLAGTWSERFLNLASYSLGGFVQGLIGAFLFIKSRTLSEYWFKNEDG